MRWSRMCRVMALEVMVIGVLAGMSGCSMFSLRAPQVSVPKPPPISLRQTELRSQAADFSAKVLARVDSSGAEPAEPLVGQATRAAQAVSGDVGAPAEAVSLPPPGDVSAVPAAQKMLDQYADELATAHQAQFDWQQQVHQAQPAQAVRSAGPGALLYWIGGLVLAVGVGIALWLKQFSLGAQVAAGGAVLLGVGIVLDRYPWLLLVALFVGVLLGALALYSAWRGQNVSTTLRTLVDAIEGAPNARAVKDSVSKAAAAAGTADVVKKTVTAAKQKAGAGKASPAADQRPGTPNPEPAVAT